MRQLVDMNDRIAIITWWEKYIFPDNKNKTFEELKFKKYSGYEKLSEDEQALYSSLLNEEGTVDIRIESILIAETTPIKKSQLNPSFIITASNWWNINKAIEEIRKTLTGKKVTREQTLYD